jgi:hypothetical protein
LAEPRLGQIEAGIVYGLVQTALLHPRDAVFAGEHSFNVKVFVCVASLLTAGGKGATRAATSLHTRLEQRFQLLAFGPATEIEIADPRWRLGLQHYGTGAVDIP